MGAADESQLAEQLARLQGQLAADRLLRRTGLCLVLLGLVITFHELGRQRSAREVVRYRYLPRQLDDIEGIESAGLDALGRALA